MRDRRSGWSGDEWIGSVARIAIAGTVLPPRKMPGAIAIPGTAAASPRIA